MQFNIIFNIFKVYFPFYVAFISARWNSTANKFITKLIRLIIINVLKLSFFFNLTLIILYTSLGVDNYITYSFNYFVFTHLKELFSFVPYRYCLIRYH